jgi:DNA invertase Pin-like site-specific DNA recombinase
MPDGMEAAHDNGVRTDNRLVNLSWKTPSGNTEDKRRHGTVATKLDRETVEAIRKAYVPGITRQDDIAKQFGVAQATVGRIYRGETWK